jgi:hypothetical protein
MRERAGKKQRMRAPIEVPASVPEIETKDEKEINAV